MSVVVKILEEFSLPPIALVRQTFDSAVLERPGEALRRLLEEKALPVSVGQRIAVTAGSRGIAGYAEIMRSIVAFLMDKGAIPFLVPAMGSHGGGTAEGQIRVLANLGITEESIGVPILSSMEVREIGRTDIGLPVYIDMNAYEADGVFLLNRVKTHTSIRGKYQSGLVKMLAIGLAKHRGAVMTHATGVANLGPNMARMGLYALERLNIVGGVSTIENGYGELARVFVSRREEIAETEPEILSQAIAMLPRIPVPHIDCLVICRQGKDISGTGMDPAVIGRPINRHPNEGPTVETLGVLRLSEKSAGNASGCGMAEFITRRFREAVSEEHTMVNSLTGMHPEIAAIPCTLPNDRLVFLGCRQSCGQLEDAGVRLVIAKDTKMLDELYMSPAAVASLDNPGNAAVASEYFDIPFDANGDLALFDL
jgi:hypothetical protein